MTGGEERLRFPSTFIVFFTTGQTPHNRRQLMYFIDTDMLLGRCCKTAKKRGDCN